MSERKERLALHVCCGPCATVCLERLTPRFEVVPIWFNPNIHPQEEYDQRLDAARTACEAFGLDLIVHTLDHSDWLRVAGPRANEPEGGERCLLCIALRLATVAVLAFNEGCDVVTTTLTVGPQKNVEMIHGVGREVIERQELSVRWLKETFRKAHGFHRSRELSEELGLYRQHYCGCEFSVRDAGPTTPPHSPA